jgi:hypothetical protein
MTHRYEIELWAYDGGDLRPMLSTKRQTALDRGELLKGTGLVSDNINDFQGSSFDQLRDEATRQGRGLDIIEIAPNSTMHPLRPLRIEVAWANAQENVWDSQNSA